MTNKRDAFTLVELLVVIAIIGILVGMLLPAVQMVREAARRTSCSNKIRNIALALHTYQSANQKFPPGWVGKTSESDPGHGWMVYTLPFVEERNLYERIDFQQEVAELPFNSPRTETFDLLLCPSSRNDSPTYQLGGGGTSSSFPMEIGRTHYLGSIGSTVGIDIMPDGDI